VLNNLWRCEDMAIGRLLKRNYEPIRIAKIANENDIRRLIARILMSLTIFFIRLYDFDNKYFPNIVIKFIFRN
jgi:hypothetical protein